jgi:quercetin dioxygenase-like cupin family protein/uncharacterized protein YgiM (DUF1202 family)
MQRVATIPHTRRRLKAISGSLVACALGASLMLVPVAHAQDGTSSATPEASPLAEQAPVDITEIFSAELESFPASPVSVRLLRITLAPGASSPMHSHPGHEFDYVESGTLTVDSEGEAVVVRDGESTTGPLAGEQLAAGELVHFPAGTGMFLQNTSDEDLVLLSAVLHPVNEDMPSTEYLDGSPDAGAFNGVSFTVLGDGLIEMFPEGGATVTVDELTVPAGSALPGTNGAAVYSLVDGAFAFAVADGNVQVSRTASPGLRPNAAQDQEFTLGAGDAAFFPNGVVDTDRANQDAGLTMLRLTAVPTTGDPGTPASIRFLEPEDDGTPELAAGEIGIGATVVTNTEAVNLREEPTTSADVAEQLGIGVELTIIGGPEEADDFTWWQVQLAADDTVTGWVAEDLISLPDAPAEEETPDATEEPAAEEEGTPAAVTDAQFQAGDIVATTEENVRIREEPTTDGEPVDVFSIGTEFEITGDPVEADDFVWYPVTQVDNSSISGWIVEDFLEPVEDDDEA